MSKIDRLRDKYPVTERAFLKFKESDTTPTKKYLEYMLKMWYEKGKQISSMNALVEEVNKFDSLLPYIPLKDIYHFEYADFRFLQAMNEKALEVKEEKSFIREEHCDVIFEDDEHFLIRPKTFKGSLKYGANTRWCTSSKNNPQTYERYVKNGLLFYLINKKNTEDQRFSKIAFYMDKAVDPLCGEILFYDSKDNQVGTSHIVKSFWNELDFMKYTFYFRQVALTHFSILKSKEYLSDVTKILTKIDFDVLKMHIQNLKKSKEIDEYMNYFQESLESFDNKIKKLNYGD